VTLIEPYDLSDKTFMDVGSGLGNVVLAVAALCPSYKKVLGIEILYEDTFKVMIYCTF
jgi:tRNA G46 methylase TrmB